MNKEQITAIAREFAEEMCAHMEDDFIKDEAIKDNELTFQMAVNHLRQRFYLVEKSKVREEWEGLENQGEISMEMKLMSGVLAVGGQMSMLQRLFPEIAEEVGE